MPEKRKSGGRGSGCAYPRPIFVSVGRCEIFAEHAPDIFVRDARNGQKSFAVLAVSDAVPVSRTADGTIFIVSANDTVKQDARLALTTLQRTGIHVLGAVLNKTDASSEGYYRYYYSQ